MVAWLLFALLAAPEAPAPPLVVVGCDAFPAGALGAVLGPRLVGPVVIAPGEGEVHPSAWRLEVRGTAPDVRLLLWDPAGRLWERHVVPDAAADAGEQLRLVALAAEYLLVLAEAPLVEAPNASSLPGAATGAVDSGGGLSATAAEVGELSDVSAGVGRAVSTIDAVGEEGDPGEGGAGGTSVAASPAVGGEEAADGWWLGAVLLAGGSGDLAAGHPAASGSFVLGLRCDMVWTSGIWVHAEVAWHSLTATRPVGARLDMVPVRAGLGAMVPWDRWQFRIGFESVFEPWWAAGERMQSGWRSGGGLLLSVGYRPLSWLVVGVDVGFDLLPEALLVRYHDDPVFSAGSWRVRGLLRVAMGGGTWM